MSEDKVKILYGRKAISYKNGKREEIPPEKTECLYKPSQPFINQDKWELFMDSASAKYIMVANRKGKCFFIKNSFSRRLWHKVKRLFY